MIFGRRRKPSLLEKAKQLVWPRGGWRRGMRYVWMRLTRLPDPPHRIARGIWAGIFASFTPLFGFHLGLGAALAWAMRGNVIASFLATLVGNPVTFPLIAVGSINLGHMVLGNAMEAPPATHIVVAFAQASEEVWKNLWAVFSTDPTQWEKLRGFYYGFFLPYLVGGVLIGLVAATAGYFASLPLISAYHALRERRRRDRVGRVSRRSERRREGPDSALDPLE